ncbi:MAG: DUF2164 domain-containing protein [Acidobacteriota bacterium]
MQIELGDNRKQVIMELLTAFYADNLDENLSEYQAQRIVEFFLETLGPVVYNQAIQDARGFMLEKLEDLDAEFYVSQEPTDTDSPSC